jgi:hypothetical protein
MNIITKAEPLENYHHLRLTGKRPEDILPALQREMANALNIQILRY